MTAPSQALRKLAEEIAQAQAHDTRPLRPQLIDHWEARLRAALPDLSGLLGELAVKTAALEEAVEHFRRNKDLSVAWVNCKSALSSESGQLAGEALVALLEWYEDLGHVCRSDEENVLQQMAARLRVEFPGFRGRR